MDQADRADERVEGGDGLIELSTVEPPLANVIPFPRENFTVTSNLLNDELEQFNPGLPLTREARDFLKEALTPILSEIPSEADLFEFKKRIAEFITMAFQLFIAGGILGVPKNLPKRENSIADVVILQTQGMSGPTQAKTSDHERSRNSKPSAITRLICHARLAWESLRLSLSPPAAGVLFVKFDHTSEIRFKIERALADCIFLNRTLERYEDRWDVKSEVSRAFMISKDLKRTARRLASAESTAQKLRDEKPAKNQTLREGAKTHIAIERASRATKDFERAQEEAHFMMTKENSAARTPRPIRAKVPTHVDRQVVIDCLASDPKETLQRFTVLLRRQMKAPVPLDSLTRSLSERNIRELSYPLDVDPILVIHEIVRRATSDATCTRKEVLRSDLMREVFDNRRLLSTGSKPWMPN